MKPLAKVKSRALSGSTAGLGMRSSKFETLPRTTDLPPFIFIPSVALCWLSLLVSAERQPGGTDGMPEYILGRHGFRST